MSSWSGTICCCHSFLRVIAWALRPSHSHYSHLGRVICHFKLGLHTRAIKCHRGKVWGWWQQVAFVSTKAIKDDSSKMSIFGQRCPSKMILPFPGKHLDCTSQLPLWMVWPGGWILASRRWMKGISDSSRLACETSGTMPHVPSPSFGLNQPVMVIVGTVGWRCQSHKEEGAVVSTPHVDGHTRWGWKLPWAPEDLGFLLFP